MATADGRSKSVTAGTLSIDEGQLGKAIVAVLEVAASATSDTTAAAWVACRLLDDVVAWQRPGGWWSYYPDPAQAPHPNAYLTRQAHYDDDGIASLVLALVRGFEVLGDERYLNAAHKALDHARLCQSRSLHGGIPASASDDGYAMAMRAYEPAGCDSAKATASMARAATAVIKVSGRAEDKAFVAGCATYFDKTKLADGRWPRYTLAYAPEPVPLYGSKTRPYIHTDRANAEPGYSWEGNWGKLEL